MVNKIDDGGPVFNYHGGQPGLFKRDWFATFAPEPSDAQVTIEGDHDRIANPHNDSYKPPRRSAEEIKADLRYRWADAMIAASKRAAR